MASQKIERVNEDIQRVMSKLLRDAKDPRLKQGLVSVTSVDTAGDLRHAKVYLSVYRDTAGGDSPRADKEFMQGLKSATGFLRRELAGILSLRYTPELVFVLDKSVEHGAKINAILNEIIVPELSVNSCDNIIGSSDDVISSYDSDVEGNG